ncbi:FCD domain-containing protein [Pelagicoccus sp. SDUM812002]|uniref:FadR/GntR family transcriptional regulator n=1 Tax=Pelagicoccus sp. SDUM812002 TaxID=3041266 RepID=UPI0028106FF1|nr:FCD domain-containing protein [Pelagicoccus sp. SDUM812002]MDQ8185380.1 FCD domain-containing protein [Pelagicoccus sp. SDUM812002]
MKPTTRFGRIDTVTQVLREEYSGPERDWLPPERALANELKVSRPLLREAIKRLQMQGYLEPIHGVGVKVVHHPTAPIKTLLENEISSVLDQKRQFAELRCLVEPQIAAWAALNAATDPKTVIRLRSIHVRMRTAPTYEDKVTFDIDFHRTLAELAQNQVLSLMLSAVADIELQSRTHTLAAVGVNVALHQHESILIAIESGDAATAKNAMQTHVNAASEAHLASD